ncbi:DUF956 family protein [Marinilactibacillus psychrotolerans]|uniref:DUF956 family protein n=1 Tax=Marinilactibacillus psychrotolerans TaxID=191770 RepID=A0AAV3WZ52_9LACT|nr:DUF956 family protein [Marinilactibacillus psychrotolerans]GEL67034.1 hypothetical protein MPS01_11890 [Marinilactibacillus psychrotolerans]GEQ36179.1 hypothetical protein M132T_16870 [Marinilactibacillus psychrotolerans]SDC77027.1 hypothetical protein SAMN04488013_10943 [Marinilactibacillus psychrotolerans]
MVESINTKVDLVIDATAFTGLTDYGKIMIGNNGFEFFNERDTRKFIQIPWEEVENVIASVMFKGRWIPRYAIETKRSGTFSFASKHPKKVLRAIQVYIDPEHMIHSLSFFDVLKRAFKSIGKKRNK